MPLGGLRVFRRIGSIGRIAALGIVAAPFAGIGASHAAANLIQNGSFESPVAPEGGSIGFVDGQSIGRWAVVGTPGNVSVVSGSFFEGGVFYRAAAGRQWLNIDGNAANAAVRVEQTIETTPGARYRLRFAVGNTLVAGPQTRVTVSIDGREIGTAVNDIDDTNEMTWRTFEGTFTARKRGTKLTFFNPDVRPDGVEGLDAVAVTRVDE